MFIREELTLKNLKPIVFILVVLILTAISVYPQRKFSGRVAEVVDGKTFVIELPNGRVTAVLQYIEIPEPEQPLRDTVKEHLEKMIFDKMIEFEPRVVLRDRTIGRAFLDGVDVSQQMLRDGAAWYAAFEKNSQTETERILYEDNETRAKLERRGIWGVENLKPAWEFRADKEAARIESEKLARQREKERLALGSVNRTQKVNTSDSQKSFGDFQIRADVAAADQKADTNGLLRDFNSSTQIGIVMTTQAEIKTNNAEKQPYLDFRVGYAYRNNGQSQIDSVYFVAIFSDSESYKFIKSNSLTIFIGNQKVSLGRAFRLFGEGYYNKRELLLYRISRTNLQKIAKSQNLRADIGPYSGRVSEKIHNFAGNLLNAVD